MPAGQRLPRSHQEPKKPFPNSPENTVDDRHYFVNFQRGYVVDAEQVTPVLYQNAMMEPSSARLFHWVAVASRQARRR